MIDLDRESAVERLIDFYGPELDLGKVDRYLLSFGSCGFCNARKDDGKAGIKVGTLSIGPASLSLLLYDGIVDLRRAVAKIKNSWIP